MQNYTKSYSKGAPVEGGAGAFSLWPHEVKQEIAAG